MERDYALTRFAVDTNILLYAEGLGGSPGDAAKARQAKAILRKISEIEGPSLIISVQVLAEFHHVLIRKGGFATNEAAEIVRKWQTPSEVVGIDERSFERALSLAERHFIPIYDAIILDSAAGRADILLSEDFQDGFVWRGVTVRNPFVTPP